MPERNPFVRLANVVTGPRTRWVTIGLWLVATVVLSIAAPKLADLYNNNVKAVTTQQESDRAAKIVDQAFPSQNPNAVPAIFVFSHAGGLTTQDQQHIDQVTCWLISDAQRAQLNCPVDPQAATRPAGIGAVVAPLTVPQAKSQLLSADGTTLTVVADVTAPGGDPTDLITKIRAYTKQFDGPNGLQVKVTGPAGITTDLTAVFANINVTILLSTVLLVLVLLILIYRSPLLAILPLLAVGVVLQIVDPLTAIFVKAGLFSANAQATGIRDVLLFGAGTDYVIFLVARYREELEHEADRLVALRRATVGVSEAITSSAGTVVLALLTLLLTIIGLYEPLGPILAIAVVIMLLAGLTLVPALLSVLGRAAFWPSVPRLRATTAAVAPPERGFWVTISRFVTRRPALALAGSATLLVVFALGNLGVPDIYNFLTGLRGPTESAAGSKLLSQHFPPGTLAPFTVVVHLKNGGNVEQQLVALDAITVAVAHAHDVAEVQGPTRPDGQGPTVAAIDLQNGFAQIPAALKTAIRSGDTSATTGAPGGGVNPGGAPPPYTQFIGSYAAATQYLSSDGQTAQLTVTLADDPYGTNALDAMAGVRSAAQQTAQARGLGPSVASVQLTGITPGLAETRAANMRDKSIVIPLVLVLVAIVLGLLLRSLVAPLYLLAAVTLNYAAALGAASFLFTKIQGDSGVGYSVPLYTFIFLVALGADYTIFLMSRVREEAALHGPQAGTQIALSRTGGVITSAGLILAGTFSVLGTLPLRDLYQLGVTVAFGILLDTFVVRGFLVPSLVVLLKNANWWPGKLPTASPLVETAHE